MPGHAVEPVAVPPVAVGSRRSTVAASHRRRFVSLGGEVFGELLVTEHFACKVLAAHPRRPNVSGRSAHARAMLPTRRPPNRCASERVAAIMGRSPPLQSAIHP